MKIQVKKIISISVILLVLSQIFCGTIKVFAENVGIQYNGTVSYGGSTVGDFSVNVKTAFCMQQPKATPGDGTQGEMLPYEDPIIQRILYYGWDGPGNIFGSDRARGIVVTSLVLSKYYNGDISGTSIAGWAELDNLAQNGTLPKHGISLEGSNALVDLNVNFVGGKQVSESKKLIADETNCINVVVPANVTLVNETKNTRSTNTTTTIYGNEIFHLEASANTNANFNSGVQKGVSKSFQPLVIRPSNSNLQDIGTWRWYDDPSQVVSFKADFFARNGDVKITKLDKGTGKVVSGTKFDVTYDGKTQSVTTDANGTAVVKDILHNTKVKVTETFVPSPYVLDGDNTKEVVIEAGKVATAEFKNERATGKTTLTKQDATNGSKEELNANYPMIGAKYGLFKSDGTLLKEFTLDEKLTASMDKLELGSYYWQETVAPTGYTLDMTKHVVELIYKDQLTPIVIKDVVSSDDVIRMNLDGQKLIQNDTNEIFKNGVEFTLTNQRTGEEQAVITSTVDGKKGYFNFSDLALDDYILTETTGVEGYKNVDPIEILHSYDKESDSFTFTVKDQKSGNVLNDETLTQLELSQGQNVDLGTYTLKDKAVVVEKPVVGISTQAHIGDGKSQTFTWGEEVKFYDDSKLTYENIPVGTKRGKNVKLHAIYTDEKGKETREVVWESGVTSYIVTDKEMTERVIAEYDYRKDSKATPKTRWFFSEDGRVESGEIDTEHNPDGKDAQQMITPVVKETPVVEPKKETPKEEPVKEEPKSAILKLFPQTGEEVKRASMIVGLVVIAGAVCVIYFQNKKKKEASQETSNEDE